MKDARDGKTTKNIHICTPQRTKWQLSNLEMPEELDGPRCIVIGPTLHIFGGNKHFSIPLETLIAKVDEETLSKPLERESTGEIAFKLLKPLEDLNPKKVKKWKKANKIEGIEEKEKEKEKEYGDKENEKWKSVDKSLKTHKKQIEKWEDDLKKARYLMIGEQKDNLTEDIGNTKKHTAAQVFLPSFSFSFSFPSPYILTNYRPERNEI